MINTLQRKYRKIKKLADKALYDKFITSPVKGYVFLKDLEPGDKFRTPSGLKGIFIKCQTNATVLVTEVPGISEEDKSYYTGKRSIAAETEVQLIDKLDGWKNSEK